MSRDVAYVALGSNLGDRDEHLARARQAIAMIPRTRIIASSMVEETWSALSPAGSRAILS